MEHANFNTHKTNSAKPDANVPLETERMHDKGVYQPNFAVSREKSLKGGGGGAELKDGGGHGNKLTFSEISNTARTKKMYSCPLSSCLFSKSPYILLSPSVNSVGRSLKNAAI